MARIHENDREGLERLIPGKNVSHDGWKVDDASYNLVVTDPKGFTFDCAMHSEQWGEGISFGRSMTRVVSDTGQVQK